MGSSSTASLAVDTSPVKDYSLQSLCELTIDYNEIYIESLFFFLFLKLLEKKSQGKKMCNPQRLCRKCFQGKGMKETLN